MDSFSQPPYAVSATLIRHIVQIARDFGLPIDQMLAEKGISLESPPGDSELLSDAPLEALFRIGLQLYPHPLLGMRFARRQAHGAFGLRGFLVQTSGTVGEVVRAVQQYERLLGDVGTTSVSHEPGAVVWRWECRLQDAGLKRHAIEFLLTTWANYVLPASTDTQRVLLSVRMQHAAPEDPALLQEYLEVFRCPVYFNQPASALVLARAALDLPLPGGDPDLHAVLERHAEELLRRYNKEQSWLDLAKSRLHQLLQHGATSRELLAEQLGMSSRNLHRRLQEAGSSYRELLDELRLERARDLLRDAALAVNDIATRLGFEESHSFSRWFRQLTGATPGEYRNRLRDAEPDDDKKTGG